MPSILMFAPAWKGGKTLELRALRLSHLYKEWRKMIIKRDNFECQECGSRVKLEIHHKKGFTNYPKLRFEPSNVVTLCADCHSLTDNYKGRERRNHE